ncbi:MAG: hypothetical protein M3203_02475 [Actinomycetota bacterium]|nr:hypothetical protein [Actinomycetota bacterium]
MTTARPDMPDLGFVPAPHRESLRTLSSSLAGGVAAVTTAADVVARLAGPGHGAVLERAITG